MQGKRILLGVSGGIAAYKSVYLLRELQQQGAEVRVVMTPSATRFVGTETFAALSRNEVPVHVFNDEGNGDISTSWSRHIHWAEWADLMIVAPCTAHTLAGLVHGFSDNMLLTTALAARCPLLLCPTMDGGMFRSAPVQRNLTLASELGFHVLQPDSGYLASGLDDTGRLPETSVILDFARGLLHDTHKASLLPASTGASSPLSGKRVLVTAGPTREFIDAVRFISNPSSGKMGLAMAEASREMGAEVTLIHGPLAIPIPDGINARSIISANDLFEAVSAQFATYDVIIMAAAVSDFSPEEQVNHKIKKTDAAEQLLLRPTPDTLKWLGENRREGQVIIGFAMETDNLEAEVERKLQTKNADWICGNLLNAPNSGFESDENTILLKGRASQHLLTGSKLVVARKILTEIFT
ncbi:MAG: bifunctional phosphopantothenoylcysteine decarboxylase / phosphopantothenate--cysteine ligase CoaB-C [Bacteroidetes bacterium HLUCCA01]|nr:MAG: bifunctional phosphopantothenoylcysteine decarboxylase / phosphopantothenate--cysteine ligase CoaB-C [Bacteroidetes bacterium HLUCCA01]